jgi:hypothetical protein
LAASNLVVERYRIHGYAAIYYLTYSYLTYSVVEWLPVFVSQASCQIVAESLSFCHRAKELRVNAYVIMPTHLHMIVFDAEWESERLRRTLADLRKFTGRERDGDLRSEGWLGQETVPQREVERLLCPARSPVTCR